MLLWLTEHEILKTGILNDVNDNMKYSYSDYANNVTLKFKN